MTIEKAFSDIAKYAKIKGIKSFMMGVKEGNAVKFHYENMLYADLIALSLAGLRQVIDMYLDSSKWSKEYKQIYLDFLHKLHLLVKETDQRVIDFNKNNKPK